MSWKDKMKEWGGGDISFLSEDGECITFRVIGEPFLIEGNFRGNTTQRIGCPIVTADGFTLLIVGKRVGRRLAKHEDKFNAQAFDLIRHGEPGDVKATYELNRCNDEVLEKQLMAFDAKKITKKDIDEAVAAAQEVAQG